MAEEACHEELAMLAEAVSAPMATLKRVQELLATLADQNFAGDGKPNYLVARGWPFELALRTANAKERWWSFTTEPGAGMPIMERLGIATPRILVAASAHGLASAVATLLGALNRNERRPRIEWLVHVGVSAERERVVLKVYLGPCCVQEVTMEPELDKEASDRLVWEAVLQLLRGYEMADQVNILTDVRARLTNGGKAPQVTFVGVDLEPDRPPRFKVYFNPNARE